MKLIKKAFEYECRIALAGNPNVGKSTVFNALTGMKQHTGNWSGKTVATAEGEFTNKNVRCRLTDIPGTYSLLAHSKEEECARNFICFEKNDAVAVVCDATALERNLNLVLQISEVSDRVVLCVNLMDEAERRGISVDLNSLSESLKIPVVGVSAKNVKTLKAFEEMLCDIAVNGEKILKKATVHKYPLYIETAVSLLEPIIKDIVKDRINARWLALRLLCGDSELLSETERYLDVNLSENEELNKSLKTVFDTFEKNGIEKASLSDSVALSLSNHSKRIAEKAVKFKRNNHDLSDRKVDQIFTGKYTAYPIMLLFLALVFWITVVGANYPSQWLSSLFTKGEILLNDLFEFMQAPEILRQITVEGGYRVLSWVVAVMLPPMAIFFPLFTLLEDSGYLPRIAYNLDKPFKCCSACGKQALTACMGFGCNAVGVTGCRIIDSERERLLAVLTNAFVPCNGRFPALITIITMFFVNDFAAFGSLTSAFILALVIVFAVAAMLFATKLLSKTLLRGMLSAFTLEMPPYRKPKIGEVIVRSLFDRTAFVLARAVMVALPAGIIIWAAANINVGDKTLLIYCADLLNPFAELMGLDGIILIAFILGFPANEIVIPIMIMGYTSSGTLTEAANTEALRQLFTLNGWNITTAICVTVFIVMHWPCSTTLMTIKKETGSLKWSFVAFLLPTLFGVLICICINFIMKAFALY